VPRAGCPPVHAPLLPRKILQLGICKSVLVGLRLATEHVNLFPRGNLPAWQMRVSSSSCSPSSSSPTQVNVSTGSLFFTAVFFGITRRCLRCKTNHKRTIKSFVGVSAVGTVAVVARNPLTMTVLLLILDCLGRMRGGG
jgi:hypothetical protein